MANNLRASDVVAARVREVRSKHGMKVADLAARCAELGMPELTVQALYKLEQRRPGKVRPRPVTVDELLVLACALSVAPVHLLVPPDPSPLWGGDGDSRSPDDPNVPNDEKPCPVTPGTEVPEWMARQFIRGYNPLPGMDAWDFYGQTPPHERPSGEQIKALVDSGPLKRWMTGEG